jgi:hypothetical protein
MDLEKMEQAANLFESKAAQIQNLESEVKSAKETATQTATAVTEVKSAVASTAKELSEVKNIVVTLDESSKKNQEALDNLIAEAKASRNAIPAGKKSFGEAFGEAVEENWKEISQVAKGRKFSMDIKAVGNMTLSGNLTGDSVHTYAGRQAILPGHAINFRDLIPTTQSATGSYVHYKENGAGEGSISAQTEGAAKTQRDYDLTEVKTVNEYIAGYTRFSKQMAKNLPFFQGTLPRLLLRDFYKAENAKFWTDVTGASGIATGAGSETDDVKKLIDAIAEQHDDDFMASYILVNHLQLARLNKSLLDTGNYFGAGGVASSANGAVVIAGVPVIAASWVTDDNALIIDRDYIERVEVESVRVEFFEQDSDNVTKNLITARIECFEAVNLMLPASARYFDFGNLS